MRYDKRLSKTDYFRRAKKYEEALRQFEREYDFLHRRAKRLQWKLDEIKRLLQR